MNLGCAECGGTCGKPLAGLANIDFTGLGCGGGGCNGNSGLTREVAMVSDSAKTIVLLQAVASLAAAGMLWIQWQNYCDNKKKR